MERGSDKHGPRLDETLAHETEGAVRAGRSTHAEEWKDPEPSGEDQPDVDLAPDTTLVGGVPDGMSATDVEGRAELAAYLGRSAYPATGAELVALAEQNAAPDRVTAALRRLPPEQGFATAQEVWSALGGGAEDHRF